MLASSHTVNAGANQELSTQTNKCRWKAQLSKKKPQNANSCSSAWYKPMISVCADSSPGMQVPSQPLVNADASRYMTWPVLTMWIACSKSSADVYTCRHAKSQYMATYEDTITALNVIRANHSSTCSASHTGQFVHSTCWALDARQNLHLDTVLSTGYNTYRYTLSCWYGSTHAELWPNLNNLNSWQRELNEDSRSAFCTGNWMEIHA